MAVTQSNPDLKVKLVQMVDDGTGNMRQSTRTYSNIVLSATDEAIISGMNALAGLLEDAPVAFIRVDEAEISEE